MINSLTDEKKKLIVDTIKDNSEMWEKILLFQKIELKEVKSILTKEKIIIGNDILKQFILSLGVVLSGGWNS